MSITYDSNKLKFCPNLDVCVRVKFLVKFLLIDKGLYLSPKNFGPIQPRILNLLFNIQI